MAKATFSIVSPAGTELTLATGAGSDSPFGLMLGSAGLGLATREVKLASSAGDGARLRSVRVAPRDAVLRILVFGADDDELLDNVRKLAAAVRAVPELPSPKLIATYSTGSSYELPFVYSGGGQDLEPQGSNGAVEIPLEVIFPDPFWTARDAVSFQVTGETEPVGLLPDLAALRIAPSRASGSMAVVNPGELPAYPVARITGPASLVKASCRGRAWEIGPVAAGEVLTVDAAAKTATLADGTNVYNRFGPAPKLFQIPAGKSQVDVEIGDSAPGEWVADKLRRKNLHRNPAGATTAGWSVQGGGGTWTSSAVTDGPEGIAPTAFRALNTKATTTSPVGFNLTGGGTAGSPVVAGLPYYVSAYILSTTEHGYARIGLQFYSAAGVALSGEIYPTSEAYSTPRAWQRIRSGAIVAPADAAWATVRIRMGSGAGAMQPGDFMQCSGVLLEQSSTLADFFYGGSPSGASGAYSWTGTPNASYSNAYSTNLVGRSQVDMFFRPRMEVVV